MGHGRIKLALGSLRARGALGAARRDIGTLSSTEVSGVGRHEATILRELRCHPFG